ncbi:MAG: ATP-dependent helicase HrpB [Myxococcaceae bacterium]
MTALPIDPLLPAVCEALRTHGALVLQAAPGAGKTTRVPKALLDARFADKGDILVLQPRRLATRLAAQRVATESGEVLGQSVGYQIRFEDVSSERTQLRFVTEGVLTRRILASPRLSGVSVVVLDEFHERHLATDLALGWLSALRKSDRPDLRVLVMSATLEADPVAAFLECPAMYAEGKRFPVEHEHAEKEDARPLEQQVLGALKRWHARGEEGHALVFLPGASEIRKALEACADFAQRNGFVLRPLHGELPPREQDLAVAPGRERRIILSTNVAETSVTIDGVRLVVDSGLARVPTASAWSGFTTLRTVKISQASAEQRAGRAGRTQAGRCIRLYSRTDLLHRPEHDTPEIARLDLAETVLALHASGVRDVRAFRFFEAPPEAGLSQAESLLRRLGAIEKDGRLTDIGRRMSTFPVHPRLARVLLEAEARGIPDEGAFAVSTLSERDTRPNARAHFGGSSRHAPRGAATDSESDIWDAFQRFRSDNKGASSGETSPLQRTQAQLRKRLRSGAARGNIEQALGLSLLAGFSDRVARRKAKTSRELLLCTGGTAELAAHSAVQTAELLLALDADFTGKTVAVRRAVALEPEWLVEISPESVVDSDTLVFNEADLRVERLRQTRYEQLVLEARREPAPPSPETEAMLLARALAEKPERFVPADDWHRWTARLAWAAEVEPEAQLPKPESLWEDVLRAAAMGLRSYKELAAQDLLDFALGLLDPRQARALRDAAPDQLALPSGRTLRVQYSLGQAPHVASRLQDFFGMSKGPLLGKTQRPLVLHLLAPNQRPVQVTSDLAGFWARHYPALRKELSRRYPRHAWPDNPQAASPPAQVSRRGG